MNIKEQEFKLPSHSMESNDGNSERLQPPSPKRIKTITPFEDHPDDADTVNLHSSTNPEDQALKYPSPSDCGSGVLSPDDEQKPWLSNGFVRIGDGDMRYETITKTLVARLSSCGFSAQVETIHRNGYSSMMSRARLHSFGIYSQAIQTRSNGNGNVKYAWYGASKHGISEILSYGFGLPLNNGVYGHGVYLSTVDHPVESLQSSTADEDGLRHMLLCRVLLGNPEVISPGSGQYHPSSQEFDSGVDNLTSPKKYIVWTTKMNTHIMPEYVVSFRILSCCNGYPKILEPPKHPSSDWMHLDTLIKALPEFLPAAAIKSLSEHHNEYKKQKITRHAMIQRVRHVVGDELLMLMIKSYGEKV
ncbi:putative inactive poly [ADP-ribose] polymerase SRO5 [Sesamum alatum]|uniref:Inactive poly [ADP-ribose] polymerase SRO5 n=1 Tax=Sesamum alatum TaxID=300844 RepID=A0AAE1YVV7_9LAMI|nr:putative inactive poly [ADP-ribose] polymerase SRO5 [Sesamum alatum]